MNKNLLKNRITLSLFLIEIILLFILPISFGSTDYNVMNKTQAEVCISLIKEDLKELIDNGFSSQKVNDTLKISQQIFDAQETMKAKGNKPDYSVIFTNCDVVKKIKEDAYKAKDEIYSLEKDYEIFYSGIAEIKEDPFVSPKLIEIEKMMQEIREDMKNEQYENVVKKIPEEEKKIEELKASTVRSKMVYSSISKGIKEFIFENYLKMIGFIVVLSILYVMYRIKIRKMIIERKLEKVEAEKKIIQEMIKKIQKSYFEEGKVSEGNYQIRTKKYAELIRNLDIQIPLLKEELEKIKFKLSKKK